jgi:hypothetical protein
VQVSTTTVLASFHRQVGPARQAYRKFMRDGLAQGHQERFYETVDQRLLGDERFLEAIDRRTAATREVTVRPQRIALGRLLPAVATAYGVTPHQIVAPGRQRVLVPARALLVYLAREWSHLTARELGRRLHRDPSMISRLAATYVAQPDPRAESMVRQALGLPHQQ